MPIKLQTLDYYLERTEKVNDCLIWTGAVNTDGYAHRFGNEKVHRSVFFLVNGFYPEVVRHSCDTPLCINPEHLLAGDNLDNVRDRVARGRSKGHVPEEEMEFVRSEILKGRSKEDIAKELGVKIKRVEHIWLRRIKDKPEYVLKGFISDEDIKNVFELRQQGLTYKQIGDRLDMTRKRVDHILYTRK